MRTWQLQEARRRFSELVSEALARGPQRVTRHGKTAVIVVSEDEWNGITRKDRRSAGCSPSARSSRRTSLSGSRPERSAATSPNELRGRHRRPLPHLSEHGAIHTRFARMAGKELRAAASLGRLADGDQLRHRLAETPESAAESGAPAGMARRRGCLHKGRIIASGDDIAIRAGQLLAMACASGTEVSAEDALIAATTDLGAMTVITANARHFAPMRVRYADPLAGLPPDAGP